MRVALGGGSAGGTAANPSDGTIERYEQFLAERDRVEPHFMSSTPPLMSEYQRDQWLSLTAIRGALEEIPAVERESLRSSLSGYLVFRRELADFHSRHFHEYCRRACYETGLSACCGFESIITFF